MDCLKMHWAPEQSSCSWRGLWWQQKKNRQQQQTLRLGEGGRHRGEREHAEEVIKGKHEGRRGVGDKEVRWRKGDLHVCEDDRTAECFAGGGYFWNWIILGVNWSGWMNAKARKVWSHKDAIPAALCLLQQKTASGFCFFHSGGNVVHTVTLQ